MPHRPIRLRRNPSPEPPRSRIARAAGMALMATTLGSLPAAPAHAATCRGTASVFALTSEGEIYRYPMTAPGSTQPGIAELTRRQIDGNWARFDRLLGGTNGYLYALDHRSAATTDKQGNITVEPRGMYLLKWDGTTLTQVGTTPIAERGLDIYADAFGNEKLPRSNHLTTDETGAIYGLSRAGEVRRYEYDIQSKKWTQWSHVVTTGWTGVQALVGAGEGILYGIKENGETYALHYDRDTDRVTSVRTLKSTMGYFQGGIFSVGGERIFGVSADRILYLLTPPSQDTSGSSWSRTRLGKGRWEGFQLTALPNTCHAAATPARTVTNELTTNAPAFVRQLDTSPSATPQMDVSMVNFQGQLIDMRADLINGAFFSAPKVFSANSLTGQPNSFETPALAPTSAYQKEINVLALRVDGHVIRAVQSPKDSTWISRDEGGATTAPVSSVRLNNGTSDFTVLFTVIDGQIWTKRQFNSGPSQFVPAGVDLAAWIPATEADSLPSGIQLRGTPIPLRNPSGGTFLVVQDSAGTFWTVNYQFNPASQTTPELSRWTRIGGNGPTGAGTAIIEAGSRLRLFTKDAQGHVITLGQSITFTWDSEWSAVGTEQPETQGDLAAVFEEQTGRAVVIALGTDGRLYASRETTERGTFGAWRAISDEGTVMKAAPAVYTIKGSDGSQQTWGIVTYSIPDSGEIVPVAFERTKIIGGTGASVAQDGETPTPADDDFRFRRIEFPPIPAQGTATPQS